MSSSALDPRGPVVGGTHAVSPGSSVVTIGPNPNPLQINPISSLRVTTHRNITRRADPLRHSDPSRSSESFRNVTAREHPLTQRRRDVTGPDGRDQAEGRAPRRASPSPSRSGACRRSRVRPTFAGARCAVERLTSDHDEEGQRHRDERGTRQQDADPPAGREAREGRSRRRARPRPPPMSIPATRRGRSALATRSRARAAGRTWTRRGRRPARPSPRSRGGARRGRRRSARRRPRARRSGSRRAAGQQVGREHAGHREQQARGRRQERRERAGRDERRRGRSRSSPPIAAVGRSSTAASVCPVTSSCGT